MKKNLAKRVVLGLLTGAVLMSSSVAWAGDGYLFDGNDQKNPEKPEDSISIIGSVYKPDGGSGSERSIAIGVGSTVGSNVSSGIIANDAVAVGYKTEILVAYGVALGSEAKVTALGGVALGANTEVKKTGSVALGFGSAVNETDSPYVVSVGSGVNGEDYATRSIINVTDVSDWKTNDSKGSYAVNVNTLKNAVGRLGDGVVNDEFTCITVDEGQTLTETVGKLADAVDGNWDKLVAKTGNLFFEQTNYLKNEQDLTEAVQELDEVVAGKADASNVYSKTEANNKFLTEEQANGLYVQIQKDDNDNNKTTTSIGDFVVKNTGSSSTVTINAGADQQVIFDEEGITVGKNSTRMDGKGFYVWADGQNNNTTSNHNPDKAIASINDKGEIKAANGAFKVDADGNVTGGKYNGVDIVELANNVASNDAVAGINQRLDKTNAKINKVGAGAAALAALHPLDYDPDDKLTFSAGMGNYAGENAAALGAFYRPNDKFMLSLGGTMGNGENMVNLGISIGLDKANGFAKMSKRELIQEVNAVKAENEAIKADNEAMKAEMAEMKAMLQELLAKK